MIKPIIFTSIFLLVGIVGEAIADCSGTDGSVRVSDATALESLLSDKTVCGQVNGEEWQEYHNPNYDLWDYKKGPGDSIDPSEPVGAWDILYSKKNGASVSYDYSSGSVYIYKVWGRTDGKYDFCSGNQLKVTVTLLPNQVSCH